MRELIQGGESRAIWTARDIEETSLATSEVGYNRTGTAKLLTVALRHGT